MIYVVDDNKVHADLAAKVISKLNPGTEVKVFTDAFLALSNALEEKPDLIVLDFMMPKLDGIELLRELRKEGIMSRAIIISGLLKEVTRKLLPSNNVAGVLPKPFSPVALAKLVREALQEAPAQAS